MDRWTFYDLETTGTDVRFDIPLQFAAVQTDGDLKVINEVEFRGRPLTHVLPAPGALTTTRQRISNVFGAPISFSQFMERIESVVSGGPASCFVAFNGMRFDEEMLRHSFYQSLRPPYQTQFGGNSRADAMLLFQAASILCPDAIKIPLNEKGQPTFKLEMLARANGLAAENAHDALADVRMMLALCRHIRKKAPEVWAMLAIWTDKDASENLLRNNDVVIRAEMTRGTGRTRSLVPLCSNPTYAAEWALIDLSLDPSSYIKMTAHDLLNSMKSRASIKPIFKVKTNAMPLVLPGDAPLARGHHSIDYGVLKERARHLRADAGFAERVSEALTLYRASFEEPVYVEDQLYSGGFFPLQTDEALVHKFHTSPPGERFGVLAEMRDPRARRLGERLLYDEAPETIPLKRRAEMQQALFDRLTDDVSVPWMTVPKAVREITKSRIGADATEAAILDEYEAYLGAVYGRAAAE